jgi:hypothetical protein
MPLLSISTCLSHLQRLLFNVVHLSFPLSNNFNLDSFIHLFIHSFSFILQLVFFFPLGAMQTVVVICIENQSLCCVVAHMQMSAMSKDDRQPSAKKQKRSKKVRLTTVHVHS